MSITFSLTASADSTNERGRVCAIIRPIMGTQFSDYMADNLLRAVISALRGTGLPFHDGEYIDQCYVDNVVPSQLSDAIFDRVATAIAGNTKLAAIWAAAKAEPITFSFAAHHEDAAYYSVNVVEDTEQNVSMATDNFFSLMDTLELPTGADSSGFAGGSYGVTKMQAALNAHAHHPVVRHYGARLHALLEHANHRGITTIEAV